MLNTEEFIRRSQAINHNRHSYEYSIYTGINNTVAIKCLKCGVIFHQVAQSHLRGCGCPDCFGTPKRDTAYFIKRSNKIYGENLFDYSKSVYVDRNTKILIVCKKCNSEFYRMPGNHYQKQSCPYCAVDNNGFGLSVFRNACNNFDGYGILYLIMCSGNDEFFYKIGITSRKLRHRFSGSAMPYFYEEISVYKDESEKIFKLEKRMHKLLKKFKYIPSIEFGGHTECFSELTDEVKEFFGVAA